MGFNFSDSSALQTLRREVQWFCFQRDFKGAFDRLQESGILGSIEETVRMGLLPSGLSSASASQYVRLVYMYGLCCLKNSGRPEHNGLQQEGLLDRPFSDFCHDAFQFRLFVWVSEQGEETEEYTDIAALYFAAALLASSKRYPILSQDEEEMTEERRQMTTNYYERYLSKLSRNPESTLMQRSFFADVAVTDAMNFLLPQYRAGYFSNTREAKEALEFLMAQECFSKEMRRRTPYSLLFMESIPIEKQKGFCDLAHCCRDFAFRMHERGEREPCESVAIFMKYLSFPSEEIEGTDKDLREEFLYYQFCMKLLDPRHAETIRPEDLFQEGSMHLPKEWQQWIERDRSQLMRSVAEEGGTTVARYTDLLSQFSAILAERVTETGRTLAIDRSSSPRFDSSR